MGKNWLIRTKSNHILGPISKEKVLELYRNGSIKPDDEVTSGNGYWFFIRETELVERFLLGHEVQGFNPISEAKDVLTATSEDSDHKEDERDDITLVGGIDLSKVKNLDSGPTPEPEEPVSQAETHSDLGVTETKKKIKSETSKKKQPKHHLLKYLGMLGFVILFLMIYFRKSIIKSIFEGEVSRFKLSEVILASAHAQDESPAKKKSFLKVK